MFYLLWVWVWGGHTRWDVPVAIPTREAARSKRASNRARNGLDRSAQAGPGPFRRSSAPVSSRLASRVIPYLCALACGPLMSFPSRLRLESCIQASSFPG
jgi:hypothetical protein